MRLGAAAAAAATWCLLGVFSVPALVPDPFLLSREVKWADGISNRAGRCLGGLDV